VKIHAGRTILLHAETDRQIGGQTDMTKITAIFYNFVTKLPVVIIKKFDSFSTSRFYTSSAHGYLHNLIFTEVLYAFTNELHSTTITLSVQEMLLPKFRFF